MNHEYHKIISNEYNECLSEGVCSESPTFSSLQEIVILYLKEIAFYLLRLKEFGMTNESIRDTVLYALFNIVTSVEYNEEQFHELITKLYDDIVQLKALYTKHCLENNIEIETTKSYFKYTKNLTLIDAIRKGEKYFLKRSHSFTYKQKDLYDIMFFLGKSLTIRITELKRLGKDHDEAYYAILSMLEATKPRDFSEEYIKLEIKKAIEIYHDICNVLFQTQKELYGEITQTEVSFSTVPGKAILVSGSDFKKLERILKEVENTEISVYTHGIEMFMAHAFPKFSSHPNLKGHYGVGMESSAIDFSSFPGAIMMTKYSLQKLEYLYRGRLFTLDTIPPRGVIKIKDNNYEPLIKSALEAKGFINAHEKPSLKVGFNEKEIKDKVDDILSKIINNKIKHLYIVGLFNAPLMNKDYFDKFFKLLPKDCYAISLSYPLNRENVFHLDSFYNYSLFYDILENISNKISLDQMNMSIFLTKCDKHTIAHLLYLNEVGIKNIYMCKCPVTLINPALLTTLQETFDIKEFSDPQSDIKATLT